MDTRNRDGLAVHVHAHQVVPRNECQENPFTDRNRGRIPEVHCFVQGRIILSGHAGLPGFTISVPYAGNYLLRVGNRLGRIMAR